MKRIYALLSLVLAGSGILFSFQASKKQEDPKKRYQLILVQDGAVIEKDTTLAIHDPLTPQAFAQLHGYTGDSLDIININEDALVGFDLPDEEWGATFEQGMDAMGAEIEIIMTEMISKISGIEDSTSDVHIEISDKGGNVQIKKTVNGKEVKISEDGEEAIINQFIMQLAQLEDSMDQLGTKAETLEQKILKTISVELDQLDSLDMEEQPFISFKKEINSEARAVKNAQIAILKQGGGSSEDHAIVIIEEIASSEQELLQNKVTSNTLKLFPNPIQNQLNIEGPVTSEKLQIKVLDLQGKVIYKDEIKVSSGHAKLKIKTEKWPNGNYEVIIEGDHFRQVEQLIKS